MFQALIGEGCRRSGGGGLRDWRVLGGRCQALGGGGGGGGQGGRCRNERWVPAAAGGVFPAPKGQEDGQRPRGEGAEAGGSPLGPGLAPGPGFGRGGGGRIPARRRSGAGQPGGGTRKGAFDSPPPRSPPDGRAALPGGRREERAPGWPGTSQPGADPPQRRSPAWADYAWVGSEEAASSPRVRPVSERPSCTLNCRCPPAIQGSPKYRGARERLRSGRCQPDGHCSASRTARLLMYPSRAMVSGHEGTLWADDLSLGSGQKPSFNVFTWIIDPPARCELLAEL